MLAVNVVMLSNPISGAGRATATADDLAHALQRAGHSVRSAHTRKQPQEDWLDPLLEDAELLAIVGGDGAVRMAAESALRTGVPIYHVPMGTENLFALEFGMDRSPHTLLQAMAGGVVRTVDVGEVSAPQRAVFTLMASIGFDAEVVHELAMRRGASISHLSYIVPILSQIRRWKPSAMKIVVDGQHIHPRAGHPEQAFVVIGNCRQYGWRMNPADRAVMDDGLLDVVCFPARSVLHVLRWTIKCLHRRQFDDSNLVFCRGKAVSVHCVEPCHYQMDGDPAGGVDSAGTPRPLCLEVQVRPKALRVLIPQ